MRSPYGRIFAEPRPPTALQARHGDIWVSPLGLQVFTVSPETGTGIWTAIQTAPAVPSLTRNWAATGNSFAAGSTGLSGQITLTATGVLVNTNTFSITGLSVGLDTGVTPIPLIRVMIVSTDSLVTAVAAACTAVPGTVEFTITGSMAVGTTLTVSFYAY